MKAEIDTGQAPNLQRILSDTFKEKLRKKSTARISLQMINSMPLCNTNVGIVTQYAEW